MSVTSKQKQDLADHITQRLPELVQYVGIEVGDTNAYTILPNNSVKFSLGVGSPLVNNGTRSEFSVNMPFEEGDSTICEYLLEVEGTTVLSDSWHILGQWHDQPNFDLGESWDTHPANNPPISLHLVKDSNGGPALKVHNTLNRKSSTSKVLPIEFDRTYRITFETVWSQEYFKAVNVTKINGVVVDRTVRKNMLNAYHNYFKLGQYRDAADEALPSHVNFTLLEYGVAPTNSPVSVTQNEDPFNWLKFDCSKWPVWEGEPTTDIYYFLPTNPDTLLLGSQFTGNVKVIFATFNGNVGLDPQLTSGSSTNSPESARIEPDDLVWNQAEANVNNLNLIALADFDGVIGAYALDDVWTEVSKDYANTPNQFLLKGQYVWDAYTTQVESVNSGFSLESQFRWRN